jgi:DinB family protein
MSTRSEDLAFRLEAGARALAEFANTLSDVEWGTPSPKDGRTLGVIVHHVATVYPVEIELALTIASGKPMTGVTMAEVDAMNARHAATHPRVTKEDAIALLLVNSAAAAVAIRALSDAELESAAPASLYGDAPVTAQFVLEDHAVRHSYHHLARLRAALSPGRVPAQHRIA